MIDLSTSSDRVDQEYSSSNFDKALTGGRRLKTAAGPSMLKLVATGTTEIIRARSRGQVAFLSSK